MGEDEEQFIVACREGPLHILKVPSDTVASASMVTAEVSSIFFKNGDISTLDSKNYRCHGFIKSKNESLWVFLQNGLLDEQIKFSKEKTNQDDSYSRVFIDLIKCDLKAC